MAEFTARERDELLAADPAAMVEAIRTLVSPVDAEALTGELGDYMLASMRGAIVSIRPADTSRSAVAG